MKLKLASICLLGLIAILACEKTKETPEPEYLVENIIIDGPSLSNSLTISSTTQGAQVFLPPHYNINKNKRYPVLYFIHGFSSYYKTDYGILEWAYDEMLEEKINEFIIVKVNSSSKISGTFCVNSPVSGNWEDYLSQEVIEYIDNNYRTIIQKESRAVAGFSMGGFGALYLGLRNADVYNVAYAISPGVLLDEELKDAFALWRSLDNFFIAYGAAFSPNLELPYPHAEIPKFDGTDADSAIIERWLDGFGNFDQKLATYLAQENRLKVIALDYGLRDSYPWITHGCKDLAQMMVDQDIPHVKHEGTGGHQIYEYNITHCMLPLISENLEFE